MSVNQGRRAQSHQIDHCGKDGGSSKGDPVGKLEVPRIGISVIGMETGTERGTLIAGAGHVPGTPLPGGNVVIAAHRDTFFRKLEGILPGDRVQV
ncbi:MAG: hypothetical protein DMG19_16590, partial [Acidobacteria bacterium]